MKVLNVRNVHEALPVAIEQLLKEGVIRESRNGKVYKFKTPVTTIYNYPSEKVLFWAERDCNPFFHFMEGLWMLAGRNDVDFLAQFNKNMINYSDDGKTFHAAYGFRLRKHFGMDQLEKIIDMLKKNPDDRRAVATIWDPKIDGLGREGKDFACNLQIVFSRDEVGKLDMTVTNRSNDIIWGAYGANAVHFAFIMEFVAAGIGCKVGKYYQISNNFHAYESTLLPLIELAKESRAVSCSNPYDEQGISHFPLINTDMYTWQTDLLVFIEEDNSKQLVDPFFKNVALPIMLSHKAFKEKKFDVAFLELKNCEDTAWKVACYQWLKRREDKHNARNS